MLTITIPGIEMFDEAKSKFFMTDDVTINLEHSLYSLSKWEAKFKKPFISTTDKTQEEAVEYIRMMCLDEDVDPTAFTRLTKNNTEQISEYINDKMTATWFTEQEGRRRRRVSSELITAEIIYYWMVAQQIPFETQYWHLNRLLTLIQVISAKSEQGNKKMPRKEAMNQHRALNAARRAQSGTPG